MKDWLNRMTGAALALLAWWLLLMIEPRLLAYLLAFVLLRLGWSRSVGEFARDLPKAVGILAGLVFGGYLARHAFFVVYLLAGGIFLMLFLGGVLPALHRPASAARALVAAIAWALAPVVWLVPARASLLLLEGHTPPALTRLLPGTWQGASTFGTGPAMAFQPLTDRVDLAMAWVWLGSAGLLLLAALRWLQLQKDQIENLATSSCGSAAVGLVELVGRASALTGPQAPGTNVCAARELGPFRIVDDTGSLSVDPRVDRPRSFGDWIASGVFLSRGTLREGDPVTVIGTALPGRDLGEAWRDEPLVVARRPRPAQGPVAAFFALGRESAQVFPDADSIGRSYLDMLVISDSGERAALARIRRRRSRLFQISLLLLAVMAASVVQLRDRIEPAELFPPPRELTALGLEPELERAIIYSRHAHEGYRSWAQRRVDRAIDQSYPLEAAQAAALLRLDYPAACDLAMVRLRNERREALRAAVQAVLARPSRCGRRGLGLMVAWIRPPEWSYAEAATLTRSLLGSGDFDLVNRGLELLGAFGPEASGEAARVLALATARILSGEDSQDGERYRALEDAVSGLGQELAADLEQLETRVAAGKDAYRRSLAIRLVFLAHRDPERILDRFTAIVATGNAGWTYAALDGLGKAPPVWTVDTAERMVRLLTAFLARQRSQSYEERWADTHALELLAELGPVELEDPTREAVRALLNDSVTSGAALRLLVASAEPAESLLPAVRDALPAQSSASGRKTLLRDLADAARGQDRIRRQLPVLEPALLRLLASHDKEDRGAAYTMLAELSRLSPAVLEQLMRRPDDSVEFDRVEPVDLLFRFGRWSELLELYRTRYEPGRQRGSPGHLTAWLATEADRRGAVMPREILVGFLEALPGRDTMDVAMDLLLLSRQPAFDAAMRDHAVELLASVPGKGPWTSSYFRKALAEPERRASYRSRPASAFRSFGAPAQGLIAVSDLAGRELGPERPLPLAGGYTLSFRIALEEPWRHRGGGAERLLELEPMELLVVNESLRFLFRHEPALPALLRSSLSCDLPLSLISPGEPHDVVIRNDRWEESYSLLLDGKPVCSGFLGSVVRYGDAVPGREPVHLHHLPPALSHIRVPADNHRPLPPLRMGGFEFLEGPAAAEMEPPRDAR